MVRPERWESVPEAAHALPSVYGYLVTFIAGSHACIGYRFSVVEYVMPMRNSCRTRGNLFSITMQDQSPFVHVGARVRVRVGPAGGGYRT